MRGQAESGPPVPAFLVKLWKMVDDEDTNHLISWSATGDSFIIKNQTEFCTYLIPLFYKHSNMASFIRQLNMYGFRKVSNIENGSLRGDKEEIEFCHEYFKQNAPKLLEYIKRKTPPKTATNVPSGSLEVFTKVLEDLDQMKDRQISVESQLSLMKQQNVALWREVLMLRRKHQKQQQIVNQLIQFILTLVQPNGRTNLSSVPAKRKYPLMIHSNADMRSKGRKSRKISDSDNANNGPTIHELDSADALFNEFGLEGSVSEPAVDQMDQIDQRDSSPKSSNASSGTMDRGEYDDASMSPTGEKHTFKFEPYDDDEVDEEDDEDMFFDMDIKPNVTDYINLNGQLTPVISMQNTKINENKNKVLNLNKVTTSNNSVTSNALTRSRKPNNNNIVQVNLNNELLNNLSSHITKAQKVKLQLNPANNSLSNLNNPKIASSSTTTPKNNWISVQMVKANPKTTKNIMENSGKIVQVQKIQNPRVVSVSKQKQPIIVNQVNKNAVGAKPKVIAIKTTRQQPKNATQTSVNMNTNTKKNITLETPSPQTTSSPQTAEPMTSYEDNSNVEDVLKQLLNETLPENDNACENTTLPSPSLATTTNTNNTNNALIGGLSPSTSNFLNELVQSANSNSVNGNYDVNPCNKNANEEVDPYAATSLQKYTNGDEDSRGKLTLLKDIDSKIDSMQGELDSLTDMLNGEGYSLDASNLLSLFENDNALASLPNLTGSGATTPNSSNELMTYTPTLDFSAILDGDDTTPDELAKNTL